MLEVVGERQLCVGTRLGSRFYGVPWSLNKDHTQELFPAHLYAGGKVIPKPGLFSSRSFCCLPWREPCNCWLLLLVLKCRLPSHPSHIPTSLSDAQWPESSPCAPGVSWCQPSSAACLPCDIFPPFSAENSARCRPRPPSPNLLGGTQVAASVHEHVPK